MKTCFPTDYIHQGMEIIMVPKFHEHLSFIINNCIRNGGKIKHMFIVQHVLKIVMQVVVTDRQL